jgi:hypothetical protein
VKSSPFRVALGALIAVGVMAASGCSNEVLPGPQPREPDFTVTVSKGSPTPTYTWSVGNAASVRVQPTDAFTAPAWIIVTENANGPVNNIASPVTHGVTPSGAQVDVANELELEFGKSYQVTVARADGTAGFVEFLCCN